MRRRSNQLEQILRLVERLEAGLITRDPGNALSAEAYDGLRKQIAHASRSHRSHVGHLVSLADSLRRGASVELLNDRVNDFLLELGVFYASEPVDGTLFDIEGSGDGPVQVLNPAVIERRDDGAIFVYRRGEARRSPQAPATEPADQSPEPLATDDRRARDPDSVGDETESPDDFSGQASDTPTSDGTSS